MLPAAGVIFGIAALFAGVVYVVADQVFGEGTGHFGSPEFGLALQLILLQVGVIVLTIVAAGFFGSDRWEVLALRKPRGGWRVMWLALIPMFAVTGIWTALIMWLAPDVLIGDLRIFKELLESDAALLAFIAIAIGAPLSEELMFRGFLYSGLAKSLLGLIGTGILTALLWTALHVGYSVFGLIEVLVIGFYFSWLLVRTGSAWVTIFCHAVYNAVIAVALYFVTLPPAVQAG
ncbi:type II CAAX endopeptidase family protein [Hyphomicrobium sp. D-2]|uniref:CPBP family intramembrane glutamic endopeptidase n=1 Tax=Hyphomicrobium sp. D-2 TaxID=3041621 RepID=UPI0024561A61|nr:type II CAAX endopeptidase family protein [Hyphomicrobium sp. D-2]MDH4983882.1 type II CAAX endopeptidase family protein [Hyphomicrobium sp. D-2]